jgi:hypothetical protein
MTVEALRAPARLVALSIFSDSVEGPIQLRSVPFAKRFDIVLGDIVLGDIVLGDTVLGAGALGDRALGNRVAGNRARGDRAWGRGRTRSGRWG